MAKRLNCDQSYRPDPKLGPTPNFMSTAKLHRNP